MEGVGARLGRSSTRFGPAAVFTGPVRKWTKGWVPLPNPNSASSNPKSNPNNTNEPHLVVYKWTPISSYQTNGTADDPPKRKLRYVPVSIIEEQKKAAADNSDGEDELNNVGQADASNGKADVIDIVMEEAQAFDTSSDPSEVANENKLDLNLG